MSPRITHSKVSGKPNPTDASKVGGEDWDADHVIDGLTIGTDVQAHDATLDALAGLTTAANKLPYFTNADVAAVTDLSAFGRSLIDDADAATARATIGLASVPREVLTANRTYYVRTDGSDSNTGLANTAGGAFLTIQKAIDTACALDLSLYTVTINVADGTYTTPIVLKSYVGVGPIYIVGNTGAPANVIISTTSSDAVGGHQCGVWWIYGAKVQTTTSGACFNIFGGGSLLYLSGVYFGACAGSHMITNQGGTINVQASYTISGGATGQHYYPVNTGKITVAAGITVTLSGTPAFGAFVVADMAGTWSGYPTFSGAASAGTYRYGATLNGVIQTYGSGASYFPGSIAGVTSTGGQYA